MVGNSDGRSSKNENELGQQMKRNKNICPVSDNYYSKCPVMRHYYYLVEEFFSAWSWSG